MSVIAHVAKVPVACNVRNGSKAATSSLAGQLLWNLKRASLPSVNRNRLITIFAIALFSVANLAAYGLILLIVGAAISLAATSLGEAVATSLQNPKPVDPTKFFRALYLSGIVIALGLLGLSLLWSSNKRNREKLRETIDGISEWLLRMGELILLATVFQLAADRTHLFAIEALAYVIFACLAWHVVKPINRFIIWPIKEAFPKFRWLAPLAGVAASILVLAISLAVVISLSSALGALLKAGIANV